MSLNPYPPAQYYHVPYNHLHRDNSSQLKLSQLKKETFKCQSCKTEMLKRNQHVHLKYPSSSSSPHQLKTKQKEFTGG